MTGGFFGGEERKRQWRLSSLFVLTFIPKKDEKKKTPAEDDSPSAGLQLQM